jgi:hypothetical protein
MSVDAEQRQRSGVIQAVPSRWSRLAEIKMRQTENEPPTSARPRFAWNMGEVSGSLGMRGLDERNYRPGLLRLRSE